MSSIHLDEPSFVNYKFATELTQEEITNFNLEPIMDKIPELGSREGTYISILDDGTPITTWKIIQNSQYRFLAYQDINSINIKIVIGEYFYSEVIWN